MSNSQVHSIVLKDSLDSAEKRKQIKQVLSRTRTVKVQSPGSSLERSRVLLIDHEEIWKGLLDGKLAFANVAFPAEDEKSFHECSKDSRRLRSTSLARAQRIDQGPKGSGSYPAVIDVKVPSDPDAKDKNGETALYLACSRDNSDDIVTLIEMFADPDERSLTKVFADGKFKQVPGGSPLVSAIDVANAENVKLLLTLGASPERRVQAVGSDGKLRMSSPLSYAADKALEEEERTTLNDVKATIGLTDNANPWDEIRALLAEPCQTITEFLKDSRNSHLAKVQNLDGFYPLHTVCATPGRADLAVVKSVIAANPSAVVLKSQAGDLPLHLALREGSQDPEVIQVLMELPNGWKKGFVKDHAQDLVDEAREYENPMAGDDDSDDVDGDDGDDGDDPGDDNEDIGNPFNSSLLRTVAGGRLAEAKDAYGSLPLHLALRNSSDEVVLSVLEKYPAAASALDGEGDSCIRLALCRLKTITADAPGASQREVDDTGDDEDDYEQEVDVEDRDKAILQQLGDVDNDGILDAEEQEALRDATSIVSKATKAVVRNPYAKVVGTVSSAIATSAKTVGGFAAMAGIVQGGEQIDMAVEQDVGLRVEPRSVEVIQALVNADPDALTREDVDGRTALHLAVELDLPAAQVMAILTSNRDAAAQPYVRTKLTLSLTIPPNLSDDRQIIGKLCCAHCVHQRVPRSMKPGQTFRRTSLLDATVIHADIPHDLAAGEEFNHALNSGQKIKLKVPGDTSRLAMHPHKSKHWVHPYQIGNIEQVDYLAPPGQKPGTDDYVYTQCGSRVKVTTPTRRKGGRPAPLLVRPRKASQPDNEENLLHRAIVNNQPDLVIMLADAYPEAVSKPNRYGMLPLHLHMIEGATPASVEALLDVYKDAAKTKNEHGDLPLHILLQNGGEGDADPEVANIIMKAYPDALSTQDSLGRYPIHSALIKLRMDSFVQLALEQDLNGKNPAAVRSPEGDLPLQLAVENLSSTEVVQALVDAYEDAITIPRIDHTSNMMTVYINADRRHVDRTIEQIDRMCEMLNIFFDRIPEILTNPELSDPSKGTKKVLCIHHALINRSVDKVLLTTVLAIHEKHGAAELQKQLLSCFNDNDSDQTFSVMLEQNRGIEVIQKCLELCGEGAKEVLDRKDPDGSYPVQVLMEHCTRPDVARCVLVMHREHKCSHTATDEERLFLAARTGDVDKINDFVRSQNVDFNAQNARGLTAKEVATKHGHHRCASALPVATSAALSKNAIIHQTIKAGGNPKMAELKFLISPYVAVSGFFLYYLDIYTDFSLCLKFGNIHFPPFNVVCEDALADDPDFNAVCSNYREEKFFYMSISFLVSGIVCTCIVDYFMLHSTEKWYRLCLNWIMNILYIRMLFEVCMAVRNRLKGRMPQAGLSAVKAAEGLFESVPQLLLQGFILFRLYLEPLRPVDEEWSSTIGEDVRRDKMLDNSTCAGSYTSWTELLANRGHPQRMLPPDACMPDLLLYRAQLDTNLVSQLSNHTNCTVDSLYHPDTFCDRNSDSCALIDLDGDECVSSYAVWSVLARSITVGLLSISTSVAMLPEDVRGQWRIAFALYILCQILFRVFSFTMALTIATLLEQEHIFAITFALLYVIQALISVPKRVKIVNDAVRAKNLKQAKKERLLAKKQRRQKLLTTYVVIQKQALQARKELDSQYIKVRSKRNTDEWVTKYVQPGNVITTVESDWLPCGKQRVQLRSGWLSVFDNAGRPMIKVHSRDKKVALTGEVVATPSEKAWIGLLTIVVPVQFDTIKNLHKSNPSEETGLSFVLRVVFNVVMTIPFIYYLVGFERDPIPYTYTDIEASPLTENIISKVWQERISFSRAQTLLLVTYFFGALSAVFFHLTTSIKRMHETSDDEDEGK